MHYRPPAIHYLEPSSLARYLTPSTIRPPFARYSHAVELAPVNRIVLCSGQLGIAADDAIPEDAGEQAELCFRNIEAILKDAGMGLGDVLRVNAFVSDREYLKPYMAVRDRLFDDPAPASTLMIVSGFARPEFKVEIEVIAGD